MSDFTILLLVLGVVLTIVTLIGHGIWVLLAAIFRGMRGSSPTALASSSDTSTGRRSCPRCSSAFELNQYECGVCAWPRKSLNLATSQPALRSLREQVERLARLDLIDGAVREHLLAAVAEQEQRVVAASAAAAVADNAAKSEVLLDVLAEVPSAPAPPFPIAPQTEPITLANADQPAPPPVAARVRTYAASRTAAAFEAAAKAESTISAKSTVPVEPPKRREALSRLFAAFMEEKNIRWGELVGGLLIVGCSIALVISFWSAIAERPLLKFGLFNGVTAALFGVGFYTDRRWKIHTTSHGILLIATLLVPLNFLAIAAFTQASPPTDVLSLAGEALSLAAFSAFVFFAGRILVVKDAVPLTAGVMIPCLMQLLVRRFAEPGASLNLVYGLAVAPVASYLMATAIPVWRNWRDLASPLTAAIVNDGANDVEAEPVMLRATSIDESTAQRLLKVLGLVSAATLLPLALLLYNVPPLRTTLHWLAPLMTACGVPALLVGLLFRRRLTDVALTALQTTGIGVGAFGAMVMAGSVFFAWPDPATLLPTALAMAAIMFAVAWWFEIPAANVPAGLAFAVAWLLGFQLLRGDIAWIATSSTQIQDALLSAASGHGLFPLVILFGALAWWLSRLRRNEDGKMVGFVAAITTAVSLALLMWFGFARDGDPQNITWTLAIYAVAALVAGVKLDRADMACAGSGLLFATLAQTIVFRSYPEWQIPQPWGVSLLLHATLIAVGCAFLTARTLTSAHGPVPLDVLKGADRKLKSLRPLRWSAQITALVAAVWMVVLVQRTSMPSLTIGLAWLAGVWMLLSILEVSPAQFNLSQVAVVLAILCGVTTAIRTSDWYTAAAHPWLDPRFLQLQGMALAIYCVVFAALQWMLKSLGERRNAAAHDAAANSWLNAVARVANPAWPMVDRILEAGLVALIVLLATYGVLPGVAQELSPSEVAGSHVASAIEQFEIAGIPHVHAYGAYAWLLLAAVVGVLAINYWLRRNDWRIIGLVVAAMTMCPLIAAHWEIDVAAASALRWLTAGFFAAGSVALWWAKSSGATGSSTALGRDSTGAATLSAPGWSSPLRSHSIRDLLVAFVDLIYVTMGAYVVQAVLVRASHEPTTDGLWWWILAWALVAGFAGSLIPLVAGSIWHRNDDKATLAARAWALQGQRVLLLLAVVPAVILSTFTIAQVLASHPLVGPAPGTWFQRIGTDVSYGVPLAVIALTLISYAVRDRSSPFAFTAGLLFNVVATIVVMLRLARGGGMLDATAWITVTQVNAIVAGVAAVTWLAALAWYRRHAAALGEAGSSTLANADLPAPPLLLVTQTALATALCIAYLAPATVNLALSIPPSTWAVAADGWLGWSAVALAAAAVTTMQWRRGINQAGVGLFVAALVSLISLTVAHWDVGNRLAFHTLLVGCCVAAWLLPAATSVSNRLLASSSTDPRTNAWSSPVVRLFGIAAVALAIWEYTDAASWWVAGAIFAVGARNIVIAWRELRRGFVWIAAVLVCLGTSIWWLDIAHSSAGANFFATFFNLCWINSIAAAAMALISVAIEVRRAKLESAAPPLQRWPEGLAFHRFAAWAIVATLFLTTGMGLAADLNQAPFGVSWPLVWAAWLAAAVTATACAWDPRARSTIACLYCVGLVAVGIYLDHLEFHAPMFFWALALSLAAYSLATSALWSTRDRLAAIAVRLDVPVRVAIAAGEDYATESIAIPRPAATWETGGHRWLVSANFLIGVAVLFLVGWIELVMPSFTHRMVAAYAIGAQALAIGLLARGTVRTSLQYVALVWGVLFAVAFGWAWLPPVFAAPWLHRLVVTVAALAVMVVVYGFGLVKFLRRDNEWTRAAAQLVPPLAVSAAALIFVVLGMEVVAYVQDGGVPIALPALVTVAVALAGLVVAALVAALVPGRDPLGLSERGRTLYVYIAEALAALLFLHIRVTMPELFQGWFLQFWPLVVMAIAFVGVGLGEVFQRRRQTVLSEPLQTTGALLPLLPALGFWILSSEIHYSLLLLSIGVLYAALSVLRKSFLYGVLAAIAANGSLWFLLSQRDGLSLFEHPQLWLIPPALCALAAGYINRSRLTTEQSTGLRYGAAIVTYVSSTADVFINGVADAPWLPAVLAGLAIIGVMAGILLRVRAFLYLGTAFLVVALMTIIWHAAIEQQRTWILWLAGIVTGALIIALFGLFEKRRDDVLRMVEELKHWQA